MDFDKNGIMEKRDLIKDKIIALAEDGINVSDICKTVGISRQTFYNWLKEDPNFQSKYEKSTENSILNNDQLQSVKLLEKLSKYDGSVGYVYLVWCIGFDYYKIGISKNEPYSRLSSLQSGCPFELVFEHVSYTPNYKELEVQLHAKYKHKRVRGEWFVFEHDELHEVIKAMDSQAKQLKLF